MVWWETRRLSVSPGTLKRGTETVLVADDEAGAWFSYDSQRIGQGRENSKTFLKQNPDIAGRIETAIRQNAGLIAEKILVGEEGEETDDDEVSEADPADRPC